MATTSEFNVNSDFYRRDEDENKTKKTSGKEKYSLNKKYPTLTQRVFTIGDSDQFEEYRDYNNEIKPNPEGCVLNNNIWSEMSFTENSLSWHKYRNLTPESVDNTFYYLFDKFKKGIYVKILNNELRCFIPFSKVDFKNEWGDKMKADPARFKNLNEFLTYSNKLFLKHVHGVEGKNKSLEFLPPELWYANNCLIRTDRGSERDRGVSSVKNMLETLCATRKVPNLEFFVNRRDFPLIKIDNTEPYEQIFGENHKLVSHRYESYCPILSQVTTDSNADIAMPTSEDWARAVSQDSMSRLGQPQDSDTKIQDFPRSYNFKFDKDWKDKKPVAVFRGSSTGCGTTRETNPRLKLASMSVDRPDILDAGITKWNLRPRKHAGDKYLQLIEPDKLGLKLVKELSPEEQSKYKYIVHVDGHVSSFRLSLELSMGSVILLAKSKYYLWFRKYLVEYVHFVPVNEDLSDLYEKIEWCKSHDVECQTIALNAGEFYDKYLRKEGILDYMQQLLCNIKDVSGEYFYNRMKVEKLMTRLQKDLVEAYLQGYKLTPNDGEVKFLPSMTYYWQAGVQYFLINNSSLLQLNEDVGIQSLEGSKGGKTEIFMKKKNYASSLNEAFVGFYALNDLIREIPNFRYVYDLRDDIVALEYVKGKDIVSSGLSQDDCIAMVMTVCLALSVAQEKYGFVHNDLKVKHVIIKRLDKPQTFTYQFSQHVFQVKTRLIPVIIDYKKSGIIYEEVCYERRFDTDIYRDISTFVDSLLRECNCMSKEIKTYISEFMRERKTPHDLFLHLSALHEDQNIIFQKIDYPVKVAYNIPFGDGLFCYDIMIGKNPLEDIRKKLMDIHFKQEGMYNSCKNIISYNYTCNLLFLTIEYIREFLEEFCTEFEGYDKYVRMAGIESEHIVTKYRLYADDFKEFPDIDIGYINRNQSVDNRIKFKPSTFDNPSKVLTLLQGCISLKPVGILSFRDMYMCCTLYDLPFKIKGELDVAVKYKKLALVNKGFLLAYNASIITLKKISYIIYGVELKMISGLGTKFDSRYTRTLQRILNVIDLN